MRFAGRAAWGYKVAAWLVACVAVGGTVRAGAAETTIVLLRHGEKPDAGLGQLSCQGLNRALALPPVLERLFGRPAAIFAPNPADMKRDHVERGAMAAPDEPGIDYSYVRPLATIEPTAIRFGVPVNTQFGFSDIAALQSALAGFAGGVIFVSWEHHEIEALVKTMAKAHGIDPGLIPTWKSGDFDSLYVVRLSPGAGMQFQLLHEKLNNLSATCP
jgi:hypothetical protein